MLTIIAVLLCALAGALWSGTDTSTTLVCGLFVAAAVVAIVELVQGLPRR